MCRFAVILTVLAAGGVGFAQTAPGSLPSAPSPTNQPLPGGAPVPKVPLYDTPPKLLFSPDPEFTEAARGKRISGNVEVFLHVTDKGVVDEVKVVKGLGYGLDEKALKAARQYRFRPAMKDGLPTACVLYVEINFQSF